MDGDYPLVCGGVWESFERNKMLFPPDDDESIIPRHTWVGWAKIAEDMALVEVEHPSFYVRQAIKVIETANDDYINKNVDVDWNLIEDSVTQLLLGTAAAAAAEVQNLIATQPDDLEIIGTSGPYIVLDEQRKRNRRTEYNYLVVIPGQPEHLGEWYSKGELKREFGDKKHRLMIDIWKGRKNRNSDAQLESTENVGQPTTDDGGILPRDPHHPEDHQASVIGEDPGHIPKAMNGNAPNDSMPGHVMCDVQTASPRQLPGTPFVQQHHQQQQQQRSPAHSNQHPDQHLNISGLQNIPADAQFIPHVTFLPSHPLPLPRLPMPSPLVGLRGPPAPLPKPSPTKQRSQKLPLPVVRMPDIETLLKEIEETAAPADTEILETEDLQQSTEIVEAETDKSDDQDVEVEEEEKQTRKTTTAEVPTKDTINRKKHVAPLGRVHPLLVRNIEYARNANIARVTQQRAVSLLTSTDDDSPHPRQEDDALGRAQKRAITKRSLGQSADQNVGRVESKQAKKSSPKKSDKIPEKNVVEVVDIVEEEDNAEEEEEERGTQVLREEAEEDGEGKNDGIEQHTENDREVGSMSEAEKLARYLKPDLWPQVQIRGAKRSNDGNHIGIVLRFPDDTKLVVPSEKLTGPDKYHSMMTLIEFYESKSKKKPSKEDSPENTAVLEDGGDERKKIENRRKKASSRKRIHDRGDNGYPLEGKEKEKQHEQRTKRKAVPQPNSKDQNGVIPSQLLRRSSRQRQRRRPGR